MKTTVEKYIREFDLLRDSDSVLVSVSGGADSMSLLHLLHGLGHDLFVVHFDHQLRGTESDEDARCVGRYCSELCIPFSLVLLGDDLRMKTDQRSVQAAARHLRYRHLRKISMERGIQRVAVAHNRDDQAETILLNIKRGTGLDGMAGMRPIRELTLVEATDRNIPTNGLDDSHPIHLIRPFLNIRRAEIEDYVSKHEIPWRTDSSNRDLRYTRNRIRHKIIPELQRYADSDFIEDIAESAAAVALLVDDVFPSLFPRALKNWRELDRRLPIEPLLSLPAVIRSWLYLRALRYWMPTAPARSTTVAAIESLIKSQPGRRVQFHSGCIWRERMSIYFESGLEARDLSDMFRECPIELAPGVPVKLNKSWVSLKVVARDLKNGNFPVPERGSMMVSLDRAKIRGALKVRCWQAGDKFVPFGMKGSKKVKSYLTDVKVKSSTRAQALVVCDDEKIIWLVGYRLDNRVRLDAGSTEIAILSVKTDARH